MGLVQYRPSHTIMRNSLSESNRYEAFHSNGLIPVMLPRNARLKLKLGSKGYSNHAEGFIQTLWLDFNTNGKSIAWGILYQPSRKLKLHDLTEFSISFNSVVTVSTNRFGFNSVQPNQMISIPKSWAGLQQYPCLWRATSEFQYSSSRL